jgi:hypothetical protein
MVSGGRHCEALNEFNWIADCSACEGAPFGERKLADGLCIWAKQGGFLGFTVESMRSRFQFQGTGPGGMQLKGAI